MDVKITHISMAERGLYSIDFLPGSLSFLYALQRTRR